MEKATNIMPKIDTISTKLTEKEMSFLEWQKYMTKLVCNAFKITPEQEREVLNYLQNNPSQKSQKGTVIGKKPSTITAIAWASPIIESLINKDLLVLRIENGKSFYYAKGKIKTPDKLYKIPTVENIIDDEDESVIYTATSCDIKKEERERIKKIIEKQIEQEETDTKSATKKKKVEGKKITIVGPSDSNTVVLNGIYKNLVIVDDIMDEKPIDKSKNLDDWYTSKIIPSKTKSAGPIPIKSSFNFMRAKSEIGTITQELIAKKDKYTINEVCISKAIGIWEESHCTIPENRFQELVSLLNKKFNRLLSVFNKDVIKKLFISTWEKISKENIKDHLKKKKLTNAIKEYMATKISPESLKYDTAKNYAKSITFEIINGKAIEYKNDGRLFEINQQVEYKTKKGILKTGKVMKIFMCDIYHQRIIVVKDNETNKSCNRKDKSIIRIIE